MSWPLQVIVEDTTENVISASVRSENNATKWYQVVLTPIISTCSCPDYYNRRRRCKHIRTAFSQLDGVLTTPNTPVITASVEQRLERLEAETRELYARLYQRDKAFEAIRKAYIGGSD